MRELKILAIVIVVMGVIYWGVEPLAHSIMHPKVAEPEYDFIKANEADVANIKASIKQAESNLERAQKSGDEKAVARIQATIDKAQENLARLESFWNKVDISNADVSAGKQIVVENCLACHNIASQGLARESGESDAEASKTYGVVPPDLSNIASVFDITYLAHFLKDPVTASKLWHKEDLAYPMGSYEWLEPQQVADVLSFFIDIAPKNLSNKQVFEQACARCHSVSYDKLASTSAQDDLANYLGTKAPDLSMIIRARGEHYLHNFINDPQRLLPGTSMPRVGVTQAAEKQIVEYLESIGDSKKGERESLGFKIVIFFVIMGVLAYLWKQRIWKDLH